MSADDGDGSRGGPDGTDEGIDQRIVDLLAWVLDTETRARIYVYLRTNAPATSEEVAEGTGLYPSTVREALAALTDEGIVGREKRAADGAGNNPYEYEAIPPSDLVGEVVEEVQAELNTVFNLDDVLGVSRSARRRRTESEPEEGPVSVSVSDDTADSGLGTEAE
ncbi:helix-turn-helix domain-containing protein [Halosegnis sp.]|uniref:helix-turn-helix domain-containing protein n=1 Tax=Halosegnis sp. TaxID=2864959 RepID=UPI0035D472F6